MVNPDRRVIQMKTTPYLAADGTETDQTLQREISAIGESGEYDLQSSDEKLTLVKAESLHNRATQNPSLNMVCQSRKPRPQYQLFWDTVHALRSKRSNQW